MHAVHLNVPVRGKDLESHAGHLIRTPMFKTDNFSKMSSTNDMEDHIYSKSFPADCNEFNRKSAVT